MFFLIDRPFAEFLVKFVKKIIFVKVFIFNIFRRKFLKVSLEECNNDNLWLSLTPGFWNIWFSSWTYLQILLKILLSINLHKNIIFLVKFPWKLLRLFNYSVIKCYLINAFDKYLKSIELIRNSSCSHSLNEWPVLYYKRIIVATHSFKFTMFLHNKSCHRRCQRY